MQGPTVTVNALNGLVVVQMQGKNYADKCLVTQHDH